MQTHGITSLKKTYRELAEQTIEIAKCFHNAGLKKGDCIGIYSENRHEYVIILFASFYLGITAAPINVTYGESK